ncbi:MAG: glycoside hydrolase family 43 protein [Actinomycetota bacterium]|nr:glycoside hydrolase family 43 protein [Actinomycetota bacterium]
MSAILSGPCGRSDFPDPFVLTTSSGYVAYGTNAPGANIQVRTSADLRTWAAGADALPNLPSWAAPGFTWSPAVLARDNNEAYTLWYAVRHAASGRQVLSVAHATSPVGPFEDRSPGPAVAQLDLGGSIDPSPFVDKDGTPYLCWKADSNAIDRPATLWAQPLRGDGGAVVGEPTRLLVHDRRWERPLIEAPSMVFADGYWLFYSGGWWESDRYGIGYATAPHPLGPWKKQSRRHPWASSSPQALGPGGAEAFRGHHGSLYLAYHAWSDGAVGYGAGGARTLRIGELDMSESTPALTPLRSSG